MLRHGRLSSISCLNSLFDHGLLLGLTDNDHPQYVNAVSDTGSINLTLTGQSISGVVIPGGVDHGSLAGLGDNDHTQYIIDSEFTQNSGILVGTGAGTYQEETGATLRTSIGVGTGDSPQLTGIELGHASDTTLTRVSAGVVAIEGTNIAMVGGAHHDGFSDFVGNEHIDHTGVTLTASTGLTGGGDISANRTFAVDGILEDLDTLGAAASDGQFIVATGAGAFAYESTTTARTSLGVGTGDSPQFTAINIGHASDTTLTRQAAGDINIEGNIVYRAGGTDVPIADGGTGQSTAQLAINALSAISGATNEHVLTKDTGTGNAIWKVAAGGGADVKVGIDVGATAGYLGAASNDGVLRTGAGFSYTDGGDFITLAVDGVLEDLDTLGAPGSDGQFIVATGAGAFAYEATTTARTSLGVGTGDSPTLAGLTITGNSVFGLNSSVFQPTTDSTTFFQVLDANGGTPIFNVDSTNERIGFFTSSPTTYFDIDVPAITEARENLFRFSVSDAARDFVGLTNATAANTEFMPQFFGAKESDARWALRFVGATNVSNDTGTDALISFQGVTYPDADPDPINVVPYTSPSTRPLMTFGNASTVAMGISADRAVFIGRSDISLQGNLAVGNSSGNSNFVIGQSSSNRIIHRWVYNGTAANAYYWMVTGGYNNDIRIDAKNISLQPNSGFSVGIGELAPETLLELTHATPIIQQQVSTHTNANDARKSIWRAKGNKTDETEHTLGQFSFSHDGTGDDFLAKFALNLNQDGGADTLVQALEIGSDLVATFAGAVVSATTTFSTVGPTDDLDVSGINTLFIDNSSNTVTIGGLAGGVDGQVLHVVLVSAAANNVTLEHNEAEATQPMLMHAGADEILNTEYGGWMFVCHGGVDWHDCSHAKHVA